MALQWVWPVFLIPVCFFMPESPWHLVRKGQYVEAEAVVRRLISKKTQDSDKHKSIDTHKALALIMHTNKTEEQLAIGTSYWDCFKSTELRRTEIACVCFAGQVLSGTQFAYNSTYFFQQVGIPAKTAYNLNVGGTGMALFAALMQWFCLAPYVGRRTNYLGGMLAMTVILYIIGFLQIRGDSDTFGMAQAVLTLLWTFVFQLSAGQLGWALPAEVSSSRLRQKTICMARNGTLQCLPPLLSTTNSRYSILHCHRRRECHPTLCDEPLRVESFRLHWLYLGLDRACCIRVGFLQTS